MKVLVTDGGERASLAVARSLGSQGIEVTVAESFRYSTASLSKYVADTAVYSSPDKDADRFIADLINIVKGGKYQVVYPVREITNLLISRHKKELEKYVLVPIPDYEKLITVHDKAATFAIALKHQIPCPGTYFVSHVNELPGTLDFPLVVKPRCKTVWQNDKPLTLKVTRRNYVANKDELIESFNDILVTSGSPPLVQEYIPGEGYGVEALVHHGDPRALFVHHRLREYPITGGASTLRESVSHKLMLEIATNLLKILNWHGVAMVEFKIDKRDGMPKLMEINGRYWGSLALPIACGVDFPYLLHKMMINGDVEPVFDYRTGVKCRWLIPGDLLWLISSLKTRNKLNSLKYFFKYPVVRDDIFSLKDPLPSIGTLHYVLRQIEDLVKGRRNMDGERMNT